MEPPFKLRHAQAGAGDIVLLHGDGSEALTHPYLAHAWAQRGADLRVAAHEAVQDFDAERQANHPWTDPEPLLRLL